MTFHATFIPVSRAARRSRCRGRHRILRTASLSWYPVAITRNGNRADVDAFAHGVERIDWLAKPAAPCANAGRIDERRRTPTRSAAPGGPAHCSAPRTLPCAPACACAAHVSGRGRARWRSRRGRRFHSRVSRNRRAMRAFISLRFFRIQESMPGVRARGSFARVKPAWAHYRPAIPTVL